MARVEPTVPGRLLGRFLEERRAIAGLARDVAAKQVGFSRARLAGIEAGEIELRAPAVRSLCRLYDVDPDWTAALVQFAAATGANGWWHSYGVTLPAWLDCYPHLEATAARLREYQAVLVPALLQTPAYAAAVGSGRATTDPDTEAALVEARLRRQSLLHPVLGAPPRLEVVLGEAALLTAVGGAAVMADQLRHLITISRSRYVSIRVLPLAAGPHAGVRGGPFVILDFSTDPHHSRPAPPVVYQASPTGALYLDQPAHLAAHQRVWTGITRSALTEAESRRLIEETMIDIHHC